MSEPVVTLATLRAASGVLSVSALADAVGIPRQTLHTRLRRDGPEITAEESAAFVRALRGFRLAFI